MKLKIDKKIEAGSYKVQITVLSFTQEELLKISKFGSPLISISPKTIWNGSNFIKSLPIHTINHSFVFSNEENADQFVLSVKERIRQAMEELRKKEDQFTEEKEIEL